MVISVPGEFYVYETDVDPGREELSFLIAGFGVRRFIGDTAERQFAPEISRLQSVHGTGRLVFDMGVRKTADAFKEGRRVLLVGQDWRDCMDILPAPVNVRIDVYDSIQEAESVELGGRRRPLLVTEALRENEGRYEHVFTFNIKSS